jgi:hypothetical protein
MPDEDTDIESTELEVEARLEGVRLAARTLEHHLTNHLTLTVGYAELIAEDPELPERLREMARQVWRPVCPAVNQPTAGRADPAVPRSELITSRT